MFAGLVVVSLLFLAAALAAAWSFARCLSLRSERDRLSAQLQAATAECEAIKRERSELVTQLRDAFKVEAGDAVKGAIPQLHQVLQNQQNLGVAQLEQRKQAIEQMLRPLHETLNKYNQSLQQIEKARNESYGALTTQVRALLQDQQQLRKETANLVTALRRPEVRGRWGEIHLRRVVELAGLRDRCDFEEQVTADGPTGRLRPDMVVRLPSQRVIAVDAKTPIDAYLEALECDDEQARQACLERHVQHIETQIAKLAAKQYQDQFDRSPDFVVLFIPGESFLEAALRRRPQLLETAAERNVLIASPTTLISLLKAVAAGWREERLAENAKLISDAGCELHDRLATALKHLAAVGSALEKAVDAHNRFVGSLETRVLSSARRFEELGAASPNPLPELRPIEILPRQPRAIEASPAET